ncbi:hypothetical protein [Aquihabitans sp. McL0605]|uniref:hypothetical protein n=1 Tax=Aquihabitans sp. McL0605 TaxID=3415671 RepID=UPI003CF3E5EB
MSGLISEFRAIGDWDLGAWDFALGIVGVLVSAIAALFAKSARKAAKEAASSQRLQSNLNTLANRLDGTGALLHDLEDARLHGDDLLARSVIRRWPVTSGQIGGLVALVDAPPEFEQMDTFMDRMKVVGEWCQHGTENLDNGYPVKQSTVMLQASLVEFMTIAAMLKTTIELREYNAE